MSARCSMQTISFQADRAEEDNFAAKAGHPAEVSMFKKGRYLHRSKWRRMFCWVSEEKEAMYNS